MGYRPKDKFDMYFLAIGNLLYYGFMLVAAIFTVGYGVYQLFLCNWTWFKDYGLFFVATIIFFGFVWRLNFPSNKKEDNNT
jgi:hypothetical protein